MKGIKICKTMTTEYKGNMFVEIRMTFLGYLLRNKWVVTKEDFERDYTERWIPCFMSLKNLLGIKSKHSKYIKQNGEKDE